MDESKRLLACPFCGGEALWMRTDDKWFVACKCGIELTTANHDRAFQRDRWNTRAGAHRPPRNGPVAVRCSELVRVRASKQTVSDACRTNHGWLAAGNIAIERLQVAYMDLQASWPTGKGARFIFTLEVEYPEHPNAAISCRTNNPMPTPAPKTNAQPCTRSASSTGSAALTERDKEVLDDLTHWKYNKGWARPMDVGGRDCSHHSGTLSKLVRLGHAEARRRCVSIMGALGSCKAGKEYRALPPPN